MATVKRDHNYAAPNPFVGLCEFKAHAIPGMSDTWVAVDTAETIVARHSRQGGKFFLQVRQNARTRTVTIVAHGLLRITRRQALDILGNYRPMGAKGVILTGAQVRLMYMDGGLWVGEPTY